MNIIFIVITVAIWLAVARWGNDKDVRRGLIVVTVLYAFMGLAHAGTVENIEYDDGGPVLAIGCIFLVIAFALAPGFFLKLLGAVVLMLFIGYGVAHAGISGVRGADLEGNMRVLLTPDLCDGPTTAKQYIIIDLDSRIVSSGCWSIKGDYVVARDMRTMQPFRWPAAAFVLLRAVP